MKNIIRRSLLLLIIPGILFSKSITATSMSKLSSELKALVVERSPERSNAPLLQFSKAYTEQGVDGEVLYPVTIRSSDIESVKAAGIKPTRTMQVFQLLVSVMNNY